MNEALLVFLPTDLLLPLLGARRRRRYALVRVVELLVISLLLALGLFEQPLFAPLLVALLPLAMIAFLLKRDEPVTQEAENP